MEKQICCSSIYQLLQLSYDQVYFQIQLFLWADNAIVGSYVEFVVMIFFVGVDDGSVQFFFLVLVAWDAVVTSLV